MLFESVVFFQVVRQLEDIMLLWDCMISLRRDTRVLNYLDSKMAPKEFLQENTHKLMNKQLSILETEEGLT